MECRICLDNDNPEDMISPCLCRGTSKYVHRECLNNWFELSENPHAVTNCSECQFAYHKLIPVKTPTNFLVKFIAEQGVLSYFAYLILVVGFATILDSFYTFQFYVGDYIFYINNLFVSSCIFLLVGLLFNLRLYCKVKNKQIYLKNYNENTGFLLCHILVFMSTIYLVPIFCMIFSFILVIHLIRNHYLTIKKTINNSINIVSLTDEEIVALREEIV